MAAIVKISSNSYGAINCGTDGKTDPKKKSHLTMAIFTPGNCLFFCPKTEENFFINKFNFLN